MATDYVAFDGVPPDVVLPADEPDRLCMDDVHEPVVIVQILKRSGSALNLLWSTEDAVLPLLVSDVQLNLNRSHVAWTDGTVTIALDGDDARAKYVPMFADHGLSPFAGTFMRIWLGYRSAHTGIRWVVPTATLRVVSLEVGRVSGELVMQLRGMSVEHMYDEARLNIPGAGSTTDTQIVQAATLIASRITPWSVIYNHLLSPTHLAITYQISWDVSALEALYTAAHKSTLASNGKRVRVWFDGESNLHLDEQDRIRGALQLFPAWYVGDNFIDALAANELRGTDVRHRWDSGQDANGVLLRIQNYYDGSAYLGVHFEDDSTKPKYYNPATPTSTVYGSKPRFENLPGYGATSQTAADTAATNLYRTFHRRPKRQVVVNVRHDPRMELMDMIEIQAPDLGIDGEASVPNSSWTSIDQFFIDGISLRSGDATAQVTAREWQTLEDPDG